MHCLGVDIVEIARIERAIARWEARFLRRVYTDGEIDFCRNRAPELACRFAAKEAVMKALGTGTRGIGWKEIEILPNSEGAPLVYLHGRASSRAKEMGLSGLVVSLSHSRDNAIALAAGVMI